MDDLAFVRERIESYAGYTNADARRRSDEQIRAYVGEALARLFERLQPREAAGEIIARLLLRCQFADQLVVRALDTAGVSAEQSAAILPADRKLVDFADRADSILNNAVEPFVVQLESALDVRKAIILPNAAATRPFVAG